MKYSIVIPCYNEQESFESLLRALCAFPAAHDMEFILVENGSTDGSRAMFLNAPEIDGQRIKSVFVDHNQGYGYGILQGLTAATGEYVGWLHADLQVSLDELFPFIDFLEREGKGQRFLLKGIRKNRSAYDRFFTAGMSIYETLLFRTKLYDIGGIPVLFHRSLIPAIADAPHNFLIELYTYYRANVSGFAVKRFPIQMVARKYGTSSWDLGFSRKIKMSLSVFRDSLALAKRVRKEK